LVADNPVGRVDLLGLASADHCQDAVGVAGQSAICAAAHPAVVVTLLDAALTACLDICEGMDAEQTTIVNGVIAGCAASAMGMEHGFIITIMTVL
jgi:hypothetical protein